MHRPRLLGWQDANCYHVISRTAGQEFLFDAQEREVFGRMLRKTAAFCGVEILTWCCLSNHFHLLIRVSTQRAEQLRETLRTDHTAFMEHLGLLYEPAARRELAAELERLRTDGHEREACEIVERFLLRIGDLSIFVKELKQRYSIWYNAHHERAGTLWDARFRSVLVENSVRALRTVACYIDLNPVRAGIVADPKDYRWCGYGQAMGGERSAKEGLRAVLLASDRPAHAAPTSWYRMAEDYRVLLFGSAVQLDRDDAIIIRRGASPAAVKKVLEAGGQLSPAARFQLRLRHLTEGSALGSKRFLQELLKHRPRQVSSKRKIGANSISGLDSDDFYSLRDLTSRTGTSTASKA